MAQGNVCKYKSLKNSILERLRLKCASKKNFSGSVDAFFDK